MRHCNKCDLDKPKEDFGNRQSHCKPCVRIYNKAWRLENAAHLKIAKAKDFQDNKVARIALMNAWKERNRSKTRANTEKHRRANPGAHCAKEAKRRSAKLLRTPNWLTEVDMQAIKEIYIKCAAMGKGWHVDHIIPLQGKLVSGFHMPSNLQIISALDNSIKSNKWEIV